MNERIKELANQAWEYANSYSQEGDGKHGELYTAKFSELIIKECIEVSLQERVEIPENDYLLGNNDGIIDAVCAIKQHFGIDTVSPQPDWGAGHGGEG